MLKISNQLSLPVEAVTETFGVFGIRGSGKTHTASVIAEELLEAGQVIVVHDPTGAWYGLKSSRDGRAAGYPVVIFGGEHADVPLEETAGSVIAQTIVAERFPVILDTSLLRKGARIRFMTDFCETLYLKNRLPLHFFADEAHTIAPQNLKAMPESARLLGAVEDIVLQGRRRGLGCTLISQRVALVNKNCSTQCSTLVAHRLTSAIDIRVIRDWVEVHADATAAQKMLDSLPQLKNGECWIWNPEWLAFFGRVKIRPRKTFDSSATPKAGQRQAIPRMWAKIDTARLGVSIQKMVEKAKADDPAELRREIARLTKELAKKAPPAAQFDERPYKEAVAARDQQIAALQKQISLAAAALGNPVKTAKKAALPSLPTKAGLLAAPAPPVVRPGRVSQLAASENGLDLNKAEKAILRAFYWLKDELATPAKVAFYSDYRMGTSTTNNALGRLRREGYLEGWRITERGESAMRGYADEKPSGETLVAWLMAKLNKAERAMLQVLLAHYPEHVPVDVLAAECGYRPHTSSWNNAIGRLRSLEAAHGGAREGGPRASEIFFN